VTATAERFESLAAEFEALRRESADAGVSWRDRERAFDRFLASGFPTTREEEWRHTSVAPIADTAFMRARLLAISEDDVAPLRLAGVSAEIVLVNGRLSPELSRLADLPAGVTLQAASQGAPVPAANGSTPLRTPFVDLNDAFHEDALHLAIAPGAILAHPLHVLFVSAADGPPALVVPRVSLQVGETAEATLVETHTAVGGGPTLSAGLVRIDVAPRAIVRHVKIQREPESAFHIANIAVELGRAATFSSTALTFGAKISRNDIVATLAGEGAECTLNGLYVVTGQALADTHTTIDHAEPHCPSHEVYKGILGGQARAVFNGKIIVRPQAQKTDAKQTNKALLLSDDAQINTKPQLEIFADDVKCTHGAAIGQLDEDALFYLRARGISAAEAKAMLIHAFAGEVLDGIDAPEVRDRALAWLDERLAAAGA
jgi:Fe-S cluster assembly protein SufD